MVVAVAVALCALAAAPAALAHAMLVSSSPPDGAVLQQKLSRVSLRFDEAVSTPFGAVRVLDIDGRRVDDGRVTRPAGDEVAVGLPSKLAHGTYTVAWRVISSDTHPVHGAFTFSIGMASGNADAVAARVLAEEATPRSVSLGFGVVRFLRFAIVLLAGGGALMLALATLGRRVELAVAGTALLLVPVAAAGIVYQGAAAGGFSVADAAHWSVVHVVLDTRFGVVWALQAALAVAVSVALLFRQRYVAAAIGLVLAAATTAASHAAAEGALAVAADGAHVVSAAAWVGGLAVTGLALVVAGARRWPLAARVVPRFSLLATGAVALLIVAGIVSAYLEIRSWSGLWTTTYGRLVLLKVGLLLPVLALGAFNNRVSARGLRLELASVRRRFTQAVAIELVLIAGLLAVTAALVEQPPAKAVVSRSGPYSTTAQLGPDELDLTVDPARLGPNEIHLYVLRPSGEPAEAAEAHAFASLPSAALGPLRLQAAPAGPGHFVLPRVDLPIAGDWKVRFEVRFGSFDQYEATVNVPIRKD